VHAAPAFVAFAEQRPTPPEGSRDLANDRFVPVRVVIALIGRRGRPSANLAEGRSVRRATCAQVERLVPVRRFPAERQIDVVVPVVRHLGREGVDRARFARRLDVPVQGVVVEIGRHGRVGARRSVLVEVVDLQAHEVVVRVVEGVAVIAEARAHRLLARRAHPARGFPRGPPDDLVELVHVEDLVVPAGSIVQVTLPTGSTWKVDVGNGP
jgi:hypothetical protein